MIFHESGNSATAFRPRTNEYYLTATSTGEESYTTTVTISYDYCINIPDEKEERFPKDDILRFRSSGGVIKLVCCMGEFLYQLVYWKKTSPILINYDAPVLSSMFKRRNMSSLQRWYAGSGRKRFNP